MKAEELERIILKTWTELSDKKWRHRNSPKDTLCELDYLSFKTLFLKNILKNSLLDSLRYIITELKSVDLGSHREMKESIQGALNIAETAISEYDVEFALPNPPLLPSLPLLHG